MPGARSMTDDLTARTLATSRLIAAPRTIIFRAIVEPKHLANWWGPAGFTNTFELCDPTPGGEWRFVMRSPDGKEHQNYSRFGEIIANERVIVDNLSDPQFQLTIGLADAGMGTQLTWRQLFPTIALRDQVASFALPANEQNIDRLQAELWNMR